MWTLQVTFKKNFFVINHAKNMRDRKNVLFLNQDPDPVLKFWFAGYGSGRKWTGSATLVLLAQIRLPQPPCHSLCINYYFMGDSLEFESWASPRHYTGGPSSAHSYISSVLPSLPWVDGQYPHTWGWNRRGTYLLPVSKIKYTKRKLSLLIFQTNMVTHRYYR